MLVWQANCNAGIGYDLHTTTPLFYHLKNEDKDKLLLMDLPAMNATNKAIAMTTMAVGGETSHAALGCWRQELC